MSVERIIGIDFGTSTSFIKVKNYIDGKPLDNDIMNSKAVTFDGRGSIAVPTIIQEKDGHFWYGYEAEATRAGAITYRNFKVDLENPDIEKKKLAKELTKKFFVFMYQKYNSQRQYFSETPPNIEKTIVSYPAKWSDETRDFMKAVAKESGFHNVEGMDEASAAINTIMLQEFDNLKSKGYIQDGQAVNLLLIDMGAGTSDLAICRYTAGLSPNIITTWPKKNIDILFGGHEIDDLLCDFIEKELTNVGLSENIINNVRKLRMNEIKAWKEYTLSDSLNRNVGVYDCSVIDSYYGFLTEATPKPMTAIDRALFENMARPYLKKFSELINGCIDHTKKNVTNFTGGKDIDLIILTGGHSQWYFIKDILTGKNQNLGNVDLPLFKGNRSRILQVARPQETVSLGLVYSNLLANYKEKKFTNNAKSINNTQQINNVQSAAPTRENSESQKTEVIKPVGSKTVRTQTTQPTNNSNDKYILNSYGNMVNGGLLFLYKDKIYYSSIPKGLYCMNLEGTSHICIDMEKVFREINIEDDYIYYTDSSGRVCKMCLTGGEPTVLESTVSCCHLNITEEWIYYSNYFGIFKIHKDGTNKTKISSYCEPTFFTGEYKHMFINVTPDNIFFASKNYDYALGKISLGGIGGNFIYETSRFINVYNGYVYYSNSKGIHKVKFDGSDKTQITGEDAIYINVYKDYIYYSKETGGLFRISINGKEITAIKRDEVITNIHIINDWIYYKSTNLASYCKMRMDGSSQEYFR